MEILTADQMRRVDRRAIAELGIPGAVLMERAGRGVTEALRRDEPDALRRGVCIVCGTGNNGGDGLVVARALLERGIRAELLVAGRLEAFAGDAAGALETARAAGVRPRELPETDDWRDPARLGVRDGALVVDALLGTGVRGAARGTVAAAIEAIGRTQALVVSIDLPSGVATDDGAVPGPAIRAGRTYTLCRPKPSLVLEPAASLAGDWSVVPIGVPDEAVHAERPLAGWLDESAAARLWPRRAADDHKGRLGHVLVVAGSRDASGAAVLAGRGALRGGAGLVTVAVPADVQHVVAGQQAELMTAPLAATADGGVDDAGVDAALALVALRDVVALGPGLGREPATANAVRRLVGAIDRPLVLDADGLNAFAGRLDALRSAVGGEAERVVLTPHPGEAARLLGSDAAAVQADRRAAALALVEATGATVVLKGRRTIVATTGGAHAFCGGGNPGMATAGSGDVLTGLLAALLARGLPGWDAARAAVWAHAAAGDLAATALGTDGMLAGDLAARLPQATARLAAAAGHGTTR